jgi:hypothetical protein
MAVPSSTLLVVGGLLLAGVLLTRVLAEAQGSIVRLTGYWLRSVAENF